MSDASSWPEVSALFSSARERDVEERERYVRERASTEEVCGEVLALLVADARGTARFEAPGDLLRAKPGGPTLEEIELRTGALLGGYRVEGVLGSGGMGTVFLARQESLERRVALKVVRSELASPSLRRRFEVEAEALARLRHPNVAQIYEAGVARLGDAEIPFFAMELIEGALPLTRFAAARGLDLSERLRLFLQACDGVQHAHERGIVHRDLKPRNVLVDAAGHVKVIDFGVARVADSRWRDPQRELTAAGEIVGTLRYMAPEQLAGDPRDIDTRTDLYALGVLLHELLSGEAPPLEEATTEGLAELVQRLRERELPRLADRLAAIGPDLDWVIARATSREPERRYPSAAELGAELERVLRGEPVLAGPPSRVYRLRRFVRRHRLTVGALLAVLLSLVGGLAFSWRAYLHAESALAAETAERERAEAFNVFVRDMLVSGTPLISGVRQRLEDVLERGTRTLSSGAVRDEGTRAALLETIGRSYLGLGLWSEAIAALEPALGIARERDGASSAPALALQLDLGWALLQGGDLERASALLESTAAALIAGGTAADAVRVLGSLAVLAKARGELTGAEELFRRAIERAEAASELDPVSRELQRTNLASFLVESGRAEEALPLLASVRARYVELEREGRGPRAGDIVLPALAAMHEGQALLALNRPAEAVPLLEEALDAQERLLGPEHPHSLATRNALALAAKSSGAIETARAAYERALEILRADVGLRHASTLTVMSNLATLEVQAKELPRALVLYEELLRAAPSVFPAEHLSLAGFRLQYGHALGRMGRYAECERETLLGFAVYRAQLGEEHAWTVERREYLKRMYTAWGKPELARRVAERTWPEAPASSSEPKSGG